MNNDKVFTFCDVLTDKTDKTYYYLSDILDLREGDNVEVPFGDIGKTVKGKVMKIGKYTFDNAPYHPNKTKYILRKVPEDERTSEDGNFLLNCGGTVLERYIGQENYKIVIPEGIVEIRPRAFANFQTLREVVLPNSLKIIGNEAFGCTEIEKVIIPDGVEQIGFAAFTYERNWQRGNVNFREELNPAEIVISKKHPYFISDGKCIFHINDDGTKDLVQCIKTGITKYDVPEDTVNIYEAAFLGCRRLNTLILHEGLKSIGREAVKYCSNNMLSIEIPDSLEDMSDLPYTGRTVSKTGYGYYKYDSNCKIEILISDTNPRLLNDDGNLYKITESDELQLLSCNSSASRIDIKDGTLSISERAFAYCERLKEIVIPSSLKGLEDSEADWYLPESVTKIEVDDGNNYLSAIDGILYDKNQTKVLFVPKKIAFKELVLPETVRDIGTAFENTQKINSIVLPEGLKKLSRDAFKGCKIRSFTVPQSLTEVDGRAFVLSQDITSAIVYGAPGSVMEAYCRTHKKVSFVPKNAVSNKPKKKINYEYRIRRTDVVLTKYIGSSKNLLLPSEIEGKPVTEVKKLFSYGNRSIKSIELPSCVTKLEAGAFSELYGLTKLKLSENLTSIPDRMCMNCSELTDIAIPDSVTSIGELAFAKSGIKTLSLPTNLKSIPAGIIYGCRNLTELVLPDGLEEICDGALYGLLVKRLVIPASVSKISDRLFCDPENKGEDSPRPPSNTIIIRVVKGSYADEFLSDYIRKNPEFGKTILLAYDDSSEKDNKIRANLMDTLSLFIISKHNDCCTIDDILQSDKEIIIPEKIDGLPVTSVNIQTLSYDDKTYTSIDFPKSVTNISLDIKVFVSKVTFSHGSDTFWSDGSAIYSADKTTLIRFANQSLDNYDIVEGTTCIKDNAFDMCNNLKSLHFPSSLKEFNLKAFRNLWKTIRVSGGENLEVMPDTLDKIEKTPYRSNKLTFIGNLGKVFMHADPEQKKVIIPEGTEYIFDYAFSKIDNSDCIAEEIVIPKTVKTLGAGSFSMLRNIKKIELPEGIESVPDSAFSECNSLEYVGLPDSLRTIGDRAFYACSSLKQIDLPAGLEVLGKDVFKSCSSLAGIILPAGLKELKVGSLEGIPFEKIEIAPKNDSFIKKDGVLYSKDGKILIRVSIAYSGNEFIIPDGVTEVMAYAFKKCKKINSLVFPDSVSKIGEYACAEMDSLTSVRLPSELTELAAGLFNECENLKNVIWPHKFTVIGNECLSGCKKLVPYIPDTLETIGERALEGTRLDKLVLPKTIKRYNSCCGSWVNSKHFNLDVYDSRITASLGSLMFESSCITVKSPETEKVLYKIWVVDNLWDLTDSQPLEVSRAFTNGWKNDGFFKYEMPGEIHIIDKSMDVPNGLPTEIEQAFMNSQKDSGYFDFETLDNVFPKIKGTMNKIKTAMNRLMYPISLTPEKDEMYRSYISKMGSKIVMHFIEEGDLESIRYVSQFDAIKKSNISNLVEAAATAKKTEIAAFLLNYKNEHLK